MNIQIILLIAVAVLILFAAFFILTSKSSKSPWKEKVSQKLAKLNTQANSTNREALKSTLSEADKLMDFFLKSSGVSGETMGERLKNARNVFDRDDYNAVWNAHKLRNRIAHEMDFEPSASMLQTEVKNLNKIIRKSL